jgi:protein-S-isoprenylcysteine O-methyltransferase Ste14
VRYHVCNGSKPHSKLGKAGQSVIGTTRLIAGIIGFVSFFAIFLFVPAGTMHWWRAWALVGVLLLVQIVSTVSAFRWNRALLMERSNMPFHAGQPAADKALVVCFVAALAGLLVFIALDVFQFHLIARPAGIASLLGIILVLAAWSIITIVLKTNAFAATVVRHQEERNQEVVERGVYSVVRHPMYAGLVAMILGIPLWLESYAGTLFAIVPMAVLAARILLEERFLTQRLQGYDVYISRVRWRLIPGLW